MAFKLKVEAQKKKITIIGKTTMIFKKPEMLVDFEVTLKVKLFFIFVQNKCVPYWPELHSTKEVGRYVVSCELEREAGDYKIRVLEIAPLDQVTYKHQTLTSLWFLISAHLMISPGFDLSCPPPPPFLAKTCSQSVALPVPQLARSRRPSGIKRCPRLPHSSEL